MSRGRTYGLTRPQQRLLKRLEDGHAELLIDGNEQRTARALVRRGLLERPRPGYVRITDAGGSAYRMATWP